LLFNSRVEIDKLLFVCSLSKFEKEIETKIGRAILWAPKNIYWIKLKKKEFKKEFRKVRLKESGKKLLQLQWSLRKWVYLLLILLKAQDFLSKKSKNCNQVLFLLLKFINNFVLSHFRKRVAFYLGY